MGREIELNEEALNEAVLYFPIGNLPGSFRSCAEVKDLARRAIWAYLAALPAQESYKDLLETLKESKINLESWGAYASEYFQDKHNLKGDIAKIEAAIFRVQRPYD